MSNSIFWFIISFKSSSKLSFCHYVTSARFIHVNILSEPGYNLTVFHFSKGNVLFAVSSLTKVILIKFYKVHCITICPVSTPLQIIN